MHHIVTPCVFILCEPFTVLRTLMQSLELGAGINKANYYDIYELE